MKEYDEKAPSKYIMYLDANNLYGWAMSQYLPTGGFQWMTESQIDKLDLAKYKEDSKKGLILEVYIPLPKQPYFKTDFKVLKRYFDDLNTVLRPS